MTRDEVVKIINEELYGAYPVEFGEIARNNIAMDSYVKKLIETFTRNKFTFEDVRDGIRKLVEGDDGKWKPSINLIVRYAKDEQAKRLRREGVGTRRIVTEDEQMYNIYLQEMKKEPSKRNEWLIQRCLPSCEIMTNPEAYKKKYGKYREEYEKY